MTAELDLVVLVPGKDERQTVEGLLSTRCDSLSIRSLVYEIIVDAIGRDPGCFRRGPGLLQQYVGRASHGLIMFDHEGSGQEARTAGEVEADVRQRLQAAGWNDRAEVIVIRPELEIWVWSDSPNVDTVLGWNGRQPDLRSWLVTQGYMTQRDAKPARPKEAMLAALREAQIAPSASNFRALAEAVGLARCTDPQFGRLKTLLVEWFGSAIPVAPA
ncbi:MAG: hypothetical protein A2341_05895 [Deltaproteobacteria bacterium RIFOXYB12_FULL_58_9]|nr:MAG: hypothetical protein A2341_05895 [Deltaproteobacteria bacterium RIFOXYB12_FULL_58_9]